MSAAIEDLHGALDRSRAPVLVASSIRHLAEVLARDLDFEERLIFAALGGAIDDVLEA